MNEIAIRANAPLPATYEQAKAALAECERIDECKDWADRAMALSSYARQAKDTAMFDAALRIQLRATERMGEQLAQVEADKGGRPKTGGGAPTSFGRLAAGKDAGLSKGSASSVTVGGFEHHRRREARMTKKEPKRDRFKRVASTRMKLLIKGLRQLGNLSAKTYEYTDADIDLMAGTLIEEVTSFTQRMKRTAPSQIDFTFDPGE